MSAGLHEDNDLQEFEVRLVVQGKVPARSGGDAIHLLTELVRGGLGPEGDRQYKATISEGEATKTQVEVVAQAVETHPV